MSTPPEHEFKGTTRFEVLRRLGQGGMGIVYEALDKERNERVALKTLRALTPDSLLRFKQEFRALQDIEHPNLISLRELIGEADDWFFTMELVDGPNFLEYVCPTPGARTAPSESSLVDAPTINVPPSSRDLASPPSTGSTQPRRVQRPYSVHLLKTALKQLVRGLLALHASGKIHRDIKPSNVLVDRTGRVVLLDFGLVADHARGPQIDALSGPIAEDRSIAGTIDYMSPEQAAGQPLDPAADWYAVGIMLYEALTGCVPFDGDPIAILMAKQRQEAPPPRTHDPSIPPELDALCADLIRFKPSERPSGLDILDRLGERASTAVRVAQASSLSIQRRFVGRQDELERLRDAFEETQLGRGCAALISGESGVGKSALVRCFVEAARTQHPQLTVLAGRCYERESVPYKAVDGVIDALSKHLGRLPKQDTLALLPPHADLLTHVFPVLSRTEAFAEAPSSQGRIVDPQELRSRAFGALRDLLRRVAQRQPMIIVIDDLQWADADSLSLLNEVLRAPDAPPLLLLATLRPVASMPKPPQIPSVTVELKLDRLSQEEARELAEQLIRNLAPGSAVDALAIAEEAGGHPLFIDELIRHAMTPRATQAEPLQLEDAFWTRIVELDEPARRLLEIVALAGGPLQQETAALAASVGNDFSRRIAALKVAHLVRTSGSRGSDQVETYHDRVRAAVITHLPQDIAIAQHRRIAIALEASGVPDPDALVVHWREAGAPAKAAHYATLAAAKAENALAFDRAARLYRECLALLGPDSSGARELQIKMGTALANAGRGGESAEAYLAATRGADSAVALDLRRRASEQFLRSGRISEGLAVTSEVLKAVGMSLAHTPARALVSVLSQRARLRLRGLSFVEHAASEISSKDLMRIDVCWSVGIGLAMVDTIRGSDFQTRNLRLSLEAGEPYRIARALAIEAVYAGAAGSKGVKRAKLLLDACAALVARAPQPHLVGLSKMAAGGAAFLEGRFDDACALCREAEQVFREQCTGVSWELSFCQSFLHWSLYFLGELDELRQRVPLLVKAAAERGDLYALTNLRTEFVSLVAMMADDVAWARESTSAAMREWTNEGFHVEHAWEIHVSAQIDLYEGKPDSAFSRVEGAWGALSRSLVLQIQQLLIEFLYLRGRSALSAAAKGGMRREHMKAGLRDAERLQGTGAAWAQPLGELLHASHSALRGEKQNAVRRLDAAILGFEQGKLALHAMAARYRLAELESDAEGIARATAWFRQHHVMRPARWVDFLAPSVLVQG